MKIYIVNGLNRLSHIEIIVNGYYDMRITNKLFYMHAYLVYSIMIKGGVVHVYCVTFGNSMP